jgi:hypothetical protein
MLNTKFNITFCVIILFILLLIWSFVQAYEFNVLFYKYNIESYLTLAQNASTADITYEYLCKYKEAVMLRIDNSDTSYGAFWFKSPSNLVKERLIILDSLMARTKAIISIRDTYEYQMAMKELHTELFNFDDTNNVFWTSAQRSLSSPRCSRWC